MMICIELHSIAVETLSEDVDGWLILSDGRLIGVAVRLESQAHGSLRGRLSLEVGFGPLELDKPEPFASLDCLETWVEGRVRTRHHGGEPGSARPP